MQLTEVAHFAQDGSLCFVHLQVVDVQDMHWQMNTDINAVFDLILQVLPSLYYIRRDIAQPPLPLHFTVSSNWQSLWSIPYCSCRCGTAAFCCS